MAGLKRSGDPRDERNGKRTKVKTGGVPTKSPGGPVKRAANAKPAAKSFVKAGKSDKNGKGKKVEESEDDEDEDEDEDDFDIDEVSDKDVDMGEDEDEDEDVDEDMDEDEDEVEANGKPESKSMIIVVLFLSKHTDIARCECIARVAREAKSAATRAQSLKTQRRYNLAIETAMGAIASQVSRPPRRAQEAHRRAFRDHRRAGEGVCVQARFGPCHPDGIEVREYPAAQADRAGAEGQLRGTGTEPICQVLDWKADCARRHGDSGYYHPRVLRKCQAAYSTPGGVVDSGRCLPDGRILGAEGDPASRVVWTGICDL